MKYLIIIICLLSATAQARSISYNDPVSNQIITIELPSEEEQAAMVQTAKDIVREYRVIDMNSGRTETTRISAGGSIETKTPTGRQTQGGWMNSSGDTGVIFNYETGHRCSIIAGTAICN